MKPTMYHRRWSGGRAAGTVLSTGCVECGVPKRATAAPCPTRFNWHGQLFWCRPRSHVHQPPCMRKRGCTVPGRLGVGVVAGRRALAAGVHTLRRPCEQRTLRHRPWLCTVRAGAATSAGSRAVRRGATAVHTAHIRTCAGMNVCGAGTPWRTQWPPRRRRTRMFGPAGSRRRMPVQLQLAVPANKACANWTTALPHVPTKSASGRASAGIPPPLPLLAAAHLYTTGHDHNKRSLTPWGFSGTWIIVLRQ